MESRVILMDKERRESYLKVQKIIETPEREVPIHIGTNLGISRDMITRGMMQKEYLDSHPLYMTTLEVYVPSLATIEAIAKANYGLTEFEKLIERLDNIAKSKGLRGNMRDIHGNVWDEKFLVLSGSMHFVQFEISDQEYEEMQQNNGSLYSIKTKRDLDEVLKTKRETGKKVFYRELKQGDFFYSPPNYAHGITEANDVHYVVDIFARQDWEEIAKNIYGNNSPKVKQLKTSLSGSWAAQANAVHNL